MIILKILLSIIINFVEFIIYEDQFWVAWERLTNGVWSKISTFLPEISKPTQSLIYYSRKSEYISIKEIISIPIASYKRRKMAKWWLVITGKIENIKDRF